MRRPARDWLRSSLVLGSLVVAGAARADRLYLEGGGVIEVTRWWTEGDWLHYEGPAGTVGLPLGLVARIESSDPAPEPSAGKPRPPGPPGASALDPGRGTPTLDERLHAAQAALARRDYETASRTFWDVLQERPESLGARIGYVVAEMALGRDGTAINAVRDGLVATPDQPALLELLGDLRNRDERVDEALEHWRAALALEPSERLRDKIAKAEREMAAGRNYDLATTSHFTVRYDGEVDRTLAGDVMDYLEEQYLELSATFRHAPPQPITVLLYPRREFREVTLAPEWVGGLYDGKIRVPLAGLRRLDPRARAVLRHELTHAVLHSKTRGQCPRWLHEGLAQIVEGRELTRAQRAELTQAAVEAGQSGGGELTEFSYPAALALTRFLEEQRGLHSLVWVLDLLGQGRSLDEALDQTYGLDEVGLRRRWTERLAEGDR